MKKSIFGFVGIAAIAIALCTLFSVDSTQNELVKQNIAAMANTPKETTIGGDNNICKWKIIDCPKVGTGNYEGCLQSGDGNVCTCGSVTRNC